MDEVLNLYLQAIHHVFRERPNKKYLPEGIVIGDALTFLINQSNPRISDEVFNRIHENRVSLIRRFVEENYLSYIPGSFKEGCPLLRVSYPS